MNHNFELEQTILGSLMLDSSIVTESLNILRDYDFVDPQNIKIFNAIKNINKEQKELDIFLVQQISGVSDEYLLQIQSLIVSTANINEHITQIRNLTLRRKFESGSQELIEEMSLSLDPAEDIQKFGIKLSKLTEFSTDAIDKKRRTVLDDIRDNELEPTEKRFSFGVKYLNDACGGYHGKDVIVIGSKTGRGKSELCNIIAEKAAIDGNKVLFLALEAEKNEIGNRLMFRTLCRLYFNDNQSLIYPLSFDKYMAKELTILDKYKDTANALLDKYARNIFTEYRNQEFTIDDLNKQLHSCKDVDLIILDHIHYIDIEDQNENKGLKKIAKCIRSSNLLYQKPIIVVAHLRKTNKKEDGLVPDEDDIFGSSDLSKIVTKTILFSPDYSGLHDNLYRTYFRVTKYRRNPSALRYVAKLYFDGRYNLYQDKYKLSPYKPFGKDFDDNCKKLPDWYPKEYSYKNQSTQMQPYKD